MRNDTLQQYATLRQRLLEEKSSLEERLRDINQVLGTEGAIPEPSAQAQVIAAPKPAKRGRPRKGTLSQREAITMALQSRGPLSRQELSDAIRDLGYVSKAKDPLNSMGIVLYAKNSPFKRKEGKFYLPPGARSQGDNGAGAAPLKKKRTMSPEARARISAAQSARWAKKRKSAAGR